MVRKDLLIGKMKAKDMTYLTVAQATGMSPKSVFNKLRGKGKITTEEAEKLAEVLGIKRSEMTGIFFAKKCN